MTRNVQFIILRDGDTVAPLGFHSPRVGSFVSTTLVRHGLQIEPKTNMQWVENSTPGSGMIFGSRVSSSSSETMVYHLELSANTPIFHFIVRVESLHRIPVSHH